MSTERRPLRSLLFAPADDERKVARLPRCAADAIVLDLEDAVAVEAKSRARESAVAALARIDHGGLTAVRLNSLDSGLAGDDLAAVVRPGLDAVVLPKVESAAAVVEVEGLLGEAERGQGLALGRISILVLVETARGILAAAEIASAGPRLATLVLGSGDLALDLGLRPTADGSELLAARSAVVLAAAAARLAPPIDGPHLALRDEEGLSVDCARGRSLGFGGRVAIHPAQLETIHMAYAAAMDSAHLSRVVAAFEQAERRGVAAIEVDGQFVDYPVYERAQRELGRSPLAVEGARV